MMYGYCRLNDFRFLEKRLSLPFELVATALYPSNLISYAQSTPSGRRDTAKHSIGCTNAASRLGNESRPCIGAVDGMPRSGIFDSSRFATGRL